MKIDGVLSHGPLKVLCHPIETLDAIGLMMIDMKLSPCSRDVIYNLNQQNISKRHILL